MPPVKWVDVHPPASEPPANIRGPLAELALSMLWGSRNEGVREKFRSPLTPSAMEPLNYETEDGWSVVMQRCPPRPGSTGEPVLLASSANLSPSALDAYRDRSLVRALHEAGYDVYLFENRGSVNASPPQGIATFDFDDMVAHDVPAAIAAIQQNTGAKRVCWLGHGLGGQLLVGHIASSGGYDIAAGITLNAPVHFDRLSSTARRAAAVARSLPDHWRLPLRRVQTMLTVASRPADLARLTVRTEGPKARGILLECTTDLALGMAQQISRWHEVGRLVDRTNRFDYLDGLTGKKTPVLVIGSGGDAICSASSTKPIADALNNGRSEWWQLDDGWGHLDAIVGADAPTNVFPKLIQWLEKHRAECWTTE